MKIFVERSAELDKKNFESKFFEKISLKKFSNKSESKIESENMRGGRVIGPLKFLGLPPPHKENHAALPGGSLPPYPCIRLLIKEDIL